MDTIKLNTKVMLSVLACLALILSPFLAPTSEARTKSAMEINTEVDRALMLFEQEVKGGQDLLNSAKGVLVIPNVMKAGLVLGGEYGEGALRVGGKTVAYYNIAGGSAGFQIGAEKKDLILLFMDDKALKHFRNSSDWTAGFDEGLTFTDAGKERYDDTVTIKGAVVAFAFAERGLMADVSIEGVKFSKMEKGV